MNKPAAAPERQAAPQPAQQQQPDTSLRNPITSKPASLAPVADSTTKNLEKGSKLLEELYHEEKSGLNWNQQKPSSQAAGQAKNA